MARKQQPPTYKPFHPIELHGSEKREEYMKGVVQAFKALHQGSADRVQQQLLIDFMLTDLCKTYDLSYQPDSDRDTAFAEGRRFVGLQITKFIKIPLNHLFPERQQS